MACKVDKLKLSEKQDRRVKLSSNQKIEIREKYETGLYSLNKLAKEYEVSKKTVLLIVNDESKKKNDQRIKEHWQEYYDKDKHTRAVRNLRNYKRELQKKGELI